MTSTCNMGHSGSKAARAALVLLALLAAAGCRSRVDEPTLSADLIPEIRLVEPGASKKLDRSDVIRKGKRRNSAILIAPAKARVSLDGMLGELTLVLIVAPVFNVGDGIQFEVYHRRAGNRSRVGSMYFDPGRIAEDRDWISIRYAVDVQKGDQIEMEAAAGPQGDLTADWLAIGSMQLVKGGI